MIEKKLVRNLAAVNFSCRGLMEFLTFIVMKSENFQHLT